MFTKYTVSRWWSSCRFYTLKRFRPNDDLIASHAPEEGQEPHMLHVVWRIRSTMRRPHWEKKIVEELGLHKRFLPVILKNTPQVNEDLTTIRHLIRVRPLVLSQGLPNGDYEETLVTWTGEFIRKPKINPVQINSDAKGDQKETSSDNGNEGNQSNYSDISGNSHLSNNSMQSK